MNKKTNLSVSTWVSKLLRNERDGTQVKGPDYLKPDRKIRKLQRKLARQQKDSNRRNKTRIRIAKQHNKITDKRTDELHKLSTKIVSENQTVILEDLNLSGMVKNRRQSI